MKASILSILVSSMQHIQRTVIHVHELITNNMANSERQERIQRQKIVVLEFVD